MKPITSENMTSLNQELDKVVTIQCPPETKKKLMDAAIACVKRKGVEKTSLNDIAKEAGCARQTVYNYYKNKDDVIFLALIESAELFASNLVEHARTFESARERVLESLMYCLTRLPDEPYLQLLTDPSFSPWINPEVFNSEVCLGLLNRCAQECLLQEPKLQPYTDEIAESMTRIVLSLITIPGKKKRSNKELREYIDLRFIPGLLHVPA